MPEIPSKMQFLPFRWEFEVCGKRELGLNNEYHEEKAFYVKIKRGG